MFLAEITLPPTNMGPEKGNPKPETLTPKPLNPRLLSFSKGLISGSMLVWGRVALLEQLRNTVISFRTGLDRHAENVQVPLGFKV